ncbi:hypothetical protein C834K_0596 [Chlamydia poikilotherma]|uniref:Uncharacterized protein n=1 Tax=Chlamydia poikilotherma TaxID=1967783 RepID=A0A3B0PPR4_9CHLA|nr:hypothetical protein [Chlamydia poikilotherma]SYX09050.1 hypothetical protein C834K_0596 [Chlamydia poikilotherma]
MTLFSCSALKSSLLSLLPILGSIRTLARLYSIYSVKDRSKDITSTLTVHTLVGIFETLGPDIVPIFYDRFRNHSWSSASFFMFGLLKAL